MFVYLYQGGTCANIARVKETKFTKFTKFIKSTVFQPMRENLKMHETQRNHKIPKPSETFKEIQNSQKQKFVEINSSNPFMPKNPSKL